MTVIDLSKYLPSDPNRDATPAVLKALAEARGVDKPCLKFPKGTWNFYPNQAYEKYYFISNNDGGLKRIAFPLIGFEDLVVDGSDSEFMFYGRILPFAIDSSKNITLKNFSVDAPIPFFGQAQVVAVGDHYTDVFIDSHRFAGTLYGDMLIFETPWWSSDANDGVFVVEFEKERNEPGHHKGTPRCMFHGKNKDACFADTPTIRFSQQGDNIRIHGDIGIKCDVGNNLFLGFETREYPCVFADKSDGVCIENVNIYHSASMGVIAQLTKDITLKNVVIDVKEGSGRVVSAVADATHFVHCTGEILMEDCSFFNMVDDATNVHGNYTIVSEIISPNKIMLKIPHFQQRGIELYEKGDKLYFVNRESLEYVATATVTDWSMLNGEYYIVTVDNVPDEVSENMAVELPEKMPAVTLRRIKCGKNRSRGFLITTPKKVLIEDCYLHNSGVGINITGDANFWFESGPVKDVTISNCVFDDCGFGYRQLPIGIDPEVRPESCTKSYHSNVVITGNKFICNNDMVLRARCIDGLVFKNNTWQKSSNYPYTETENEAIALDGCPNAVIEEPIVEKSV